MKNEIIFIALALSLLSIISAFGISSPYWEGNPLKIEKGETKIINLNIQNMVGEEDITIKAEIIQGKEIASLQQDTFFIKAGTSNTTIPLKVTISEKAEQENQTIKIDFKKISEDSKGIVIGTGMSVYFDVITSNEDSKTNNSFLKIILIGIGALAIITYIILRKK